MNNNFDKNSKIADEWNKKLLIRPQIIFKKTTHADKFIKELKVISIIYNFKIFEDDIKIAHTGNLN